MPNNENLQAYGLFVLIWASLFFGFLALPLIPTPLNYYLAFVSTIATVVVAVLYFLSKKQKMNISPLKIEYPTRNATLEVQDPKHSFKIHLVNVPIGHKPDVLEENARGVQTSLVYKSGPKPEDIVSVTLPWLQAEVQPRSG
jgi:hypothetical protein